MHLLYLDDSGSVGNAADRHLILAGVAVFERLPYWFSGHLDVIARRAAPEFWQELEFRGVDIFSGRKRWRKIKKDVRENAYGDALTVLGRSSQVRLFGAAIHKAAVSPEDPMEYAFEQLINRFDRFLARLHRMNNTQRGIVILDKSSYETSLQSLAREFRLDGHRWGQLHNIGETPLFVDSRATRMIQFADLVAYALRKYYENGLSMHFDKIAHLFDAEGGVIHGLVHYTPAGAACGCHICRQRGVY
ncbi:MAG TPA: DUF3800 domain-containing protein [Stellaceae bacterium]|nr:DUF3800 domain-containing protein [Stellaceae bacterium]